MVKKIVLTNTTLLFLLASIKLLIHLLVNLGAYGIFRDELYYLACADHLALGYVDQPPLSIAILAAWRLVFGDSLFAIRLFPAILGAVIVFLTGKIVQEMGGARFAQILAAVAVIVAPGYLGIHGYFSMNVIVSALPGPSAIPEGRVPFDDLLEQADVISLHCPLNEHTEGLFGASEFGRMKSSAILINTARGALVDTTALADALKNGEIAGAAIDVLPKEPPVDGDPLLDYEGDNLIVTPHIAWSTDRARQEAIGELAANVAAFLDGQKRNRIV